MDRKIEHQFGLIGYPLSHSFSKKYFSQKFSNESLIGYHYENYPIKNISDFPGLIKNIPNLQGLNVTIPHKQAVIPFLDAISDEAAAIGAVNTIKIKNGKTTGYNTDVYGFEVSLQELLKGAADDYQNLNAFILGTGGAAKAVKYTLQKMGISFQMVSRSRKPNHLTYEQISEDLLKNHRLIINTTPLGMSPHIDTAPALPYGAIGASHFLYDLVYNPEVTLFLKKGLNRGARIMNGLKMLYLQAEKAWEIWQRENE